MRSDTTEKIKGPGGGTPEPQNIAFLSNAVFLYSEHYQHGNPNEQWLALPRTMFEAVIEAAIDHLDAIDCHVRQSSSTAEAPENAL